MEPKQQPPYPLRMPQELRDRITEEAKTAMRSVNAEIVSRLQASFEAAAPAAAIAKLLSRISRLNLVLSSYRRRRHDPIPDLISRLPPVVQEMLFARAQETDRDLSEAVLDALVAGLAPGTKPVVYVQVQAGADLSGYQAALADAATLADPESKVYVEQQRMAHMPADHASLPMPGPRRRPDPSR